MKNQTIETIRENLNSFRGAWPTVCSETGLDYSWLTKFAQGKIPNPGFIKIQALNDYFTEIEARKASGRCIACGAVKRQKHTESQ